MTPAKYKIVGGHSVALKMHYVISELPKNYRSSRVEKIREAIICDYNKNTCTSSNK